MSCGAVAPNATLAQAEPYLEVVVLVLLGLRSALLVFCKLQGGRGRGNGLWLLVLFFSFVLCAYGLGLLLELAAGAA
jgi:hypothetical protein